MLFVNAVSVTTNSSYMLFVNAVSVTTDSSYYKQQLLQTAVTCKQRFVLFLQIR